MLRIAHWVLAILILLLGLAHVGVGFYCRTPSEDTLWFIGSGIAILFAGVFNMLVNLAPARAVRITTIAVNTVTAALFLFAAQFVQGAQVYIGLALFLFAAVITFRKQRRIAAGE